MIYLDTHVLAWLHNKKEKSLSGTAIKLIDENLLFISPFVQFELQYLYEIGRIKVPSQQIIEDLTPGLGLEVCDESFQDVLSIALNENWTRDPFNRIIVSQAKYSNSPLLTKDSSILKNYEFAIW